MPTTITMITTKKTITSMITKNLLKLPHPAGKSAVLLLLRSGGNLKVTLVGKAPGCGIHMHAQADSIPGAKGCYIRTGAAAVLIATGNAQQNIPHAVQICRGKRLLRTGGQPRQGGKRSIRGKIHGTVRSVQRKERPLLMQR